MRTLIAVFLSGVVAFEPTPERAARLAREMLIVDTHIDVPYRLLEDPEDVSRRTKRGDFDAERARQGGLDVLFQSIYVPAAYQKGGAKHFADTLIDLVENLANQNPETSAGARRRFRRGGGISHVQDETFDQVVELSRAPLIASHSSCRHFTPVFERNLDDARIRRLAANGGARRLAAAR